MIERIKIIRLRVISLFLVSVVSFMFFIIECLSLGVKAGGNYTDFGQSEIINGFLFPNCLAISSVINGING